MRFKFKNKLFFRNRPIIKLTILIILLIGLCFGLFVFEYKGYNNMIRNKYPQFGFLFNVPKLLDVFYFHYGFTGSSLPVYDLIVDPVDFQKLEKSLSENPSDLLLSKYRKSIGAELIYNKQSYSVKIRIRGDFVEHWKYKKKSWKITFDDANLLEGKKSVSLIIPEDRSLISEHVSNFRAKKLGLMFPDSRFVILKINGRHQAVYFEVEGWTKEFLEKSQRPNEANLYGENDSLAFQGYSHDVLEHPAYWDKYTSDEQNQINNFADIDLLGKLVHQSSDEKFYKQISAILDMDSFYKWQVHSVLMGSTHQGFNHNMRLYFNIAKGKFEFISWDVMQFDRDKFVDLHYSSLVSRLLASPEFLHQRNIVLWNYVKDDKNLEDDLNYYDQIYQQTKTAFYKDRIKPYSNFYFDRKIKNNKDLLIQQYRNIQNTLKDNQTLATIRILPEVIQVDITTRGFSDILLSPEAISFYIDENNNGFFDQTDILLQDNFQMYSQREIPSDFSFEKEYQILPTTYTFFISKNDFKPDEFKLKIFNAVTGGKIKPVTRFVDEETFNYFEQITYSREEFLAKNPIFKKGTLGNQIILYSGIYQISDTIIIPSGLSLEIRPGSQLEFSPGASLVSYSQIIAQGTKQKPIIFTARDKNRGWGIIAIVDSEESIFENCLVEYGGQDYINGAFFSGQLAIHYTDVIIKNCQFKFAFGDDGLNIKKSKVNLDHNYFYQNKFDGLDLDWVSGRLANSHFLNNNNDALDLGGTNNLIIWNNRIEESKDKCISIGENSKETIIANNLVSNCKIGIAIKDNSEVNLINNTIVNNNTGISVYEKKPVFGGALPIANNNIIWYNDQSIKLDDKSDIDISYSNIEGGYQGENNINQKPIFQDPEKGDFSLLDNQENLSLIKGGSLRAINTILKEKLEVVPIGLINLPSIIND